MAHTPTSVRRQRKREKAGLPPIVHGAPKSSTGKMQNRDVYLRSDLTEGQVAFIRFVGVVTGKQWLIDDHYRLWTKDTFKQRANLKRRYDEGAKRIKKAA